MKFSYRCLIKLIVFVFLFQSGQLLAYHEKTTHLKINENAVSQSNTFDIFLKEKLGFPDGIKQNIMKSEIIEWIMKGGEREDDWFSDDGTSFRFRNHFHDPLVEPWASAGLSGSDSALVWAQRIPVKNGYSWLSARQWFYNAVTNVNTLFIGPEYSYSITFRAIGQLMHLVSDAAVPAHVRNDLHPGHGLGYFDIRLAEDLYEKCTSSDIG